MGLPFQQRWRFATTGWRVQGDSTGVYPAHCRDQRTRVTRGKWHGQTPPGLPSCRTWSAPSQDGARSGLLFLKLRTVELARVRELGDARARATDSARRGGAEREREVVTGSESESESKSESEGRRTCEHGHERERMRVRQRERERERGGGEGSCEAAHMWRTVHWS